MNTSGLSRHGRGQSASGRVYVGCLPCGQGRWVSDLEHANRWLERHWERCRGPLSARGARASVSPCEPVKGAA